MVLVNTSNLATLRLPYSFVSSAFSVLKFIPQPTVVSNEPEMAPSANLKRTACAGVAKATPTAATAAARPIALQALPVGFMFDIVFVPL